MTENDAMLLRDQPLTTDQQLQDRVELLLCNATQRQFWMLFLNEDDFLLDPIMPFGDYPRDPQLQTHTEDLGIQPHAVVLAHRISMIMELVGATQVVLVWERLGVRHVGGSDTRWARALATSCGELEVRVRAQFLLHSDGVRALTPDDYA